MESNELVGTSVQRWTVMEGYFGVFPSTLMSLMSTDLMPSACETDMIGMVGMYALQFAAESPSAIVDCNNNFSDDPDKAVIFHCSNLPKHFFEDFKNGPQRDFRRRPRRGEDIWNHFRSAQKWPANLLSRLDGRSPRDNARLRRGG